MSPGNERRRYTGTPSPIGRVHNQNNSCICDSLNLRQLSTLRCLINSRLGGYNYSFCNQSFVWIHRKRILARRNVSTTLMCHVFCFRLGNTFIQTTYTRNCMLLFGFRVVFLQYMQYDADLCHDNRPTDSCHQTTTGCAVLHASQSTGGLFSYHNFWRCLFHSTFLCDPAH